MGRLDFFRQHFAFRRCEPAQQACPFLGSSGAHIDFDNVGILTQRDAWIVGREVVERDEISSRLQAFTGGDDAIFGLDGFQNLSDSLMGRQQRNQILEQDFASAIHKGTAAIAKRVDSEKQGGIEGGKRGQFRIGIEIAFYPIPEQDFVSEHFLRAIENWLPGYKPLSWQRERGRLRDGVFGGSGFHPYYIGEAERNFRR